MFIWDWFTGVLGYLGKCQIIARLVSLWLGTLFFIVFTRFVCKQRQLTHPALFPRQVYGKNLENFFSLDWTMLVKQRCSTC